MGPSGARRPGAELRVLQVHNRYRSGSPSGENDVVDNEAGALERYGHIVERFERHSDEIEHWGVGKKALLPGRILWSPQAYADLAKALRQGRPDVVHVHNTFPLLSSSVLNACSRQRVPVVATLHNYRLMCPAGGLFRDGAPCRECAGRLPVPAVRHRCYRGSALATLPLAISTVASRSTWRDLVSAYICVSQAQRDKLAPLGLPARRVFIKPNLISAAEPAPVPAHHGDLAVYMGRLADYKGVRTLMKAWDLHRTLAPAAASPAGGLRLAIAGAGPLENEVAAWSAGRSDVEFLGLLKPAQCQSLMAGARVAVVPSESEETFGLVAVEAMRAGVPVVAARMGALPELVTDGHQGALFTPGDVDALAQVLCDVAVSPERYAGYGANARTAYQTRFDPEVNIVQLVSVYQYAVDNPVWSRGNSRAAGPVVVGAEL